MWSFLQLNLIFRQIQSSIYHYLIVLDKNKEIISCKSVGLGLLENSENLFDCLPPSFYKVWSLFTLSLCLFHFRQVCETLIKYVVPMSQILGSKALYIWSFVLFVVCFRGTFKKEFENLFAPKNCTVIRDVFNLQSFRALQVVVPYVGLDVFGHCYDFV